ncbi:MAG: hypothetical protein ACRD22_15690 [Terriglobia bacterium]
MVWFVAIAVSFGALAIYVSKWFIVPFFASVFIPTFFIDRIVCPKCGTPVSYQGSLAGKRLRGGFIHKKCKKCGSNLDGIPQASD